MRSILAAVLLLLLSGCATTPATPSETLRGAADTLRAAIEREVDDPGRQAHALRLVDRLAGELSHLASTNAAMGEEATRLFADYNTTRKDFDLLLNAAQASRERARNKVVDLRLQLAALLTSEEWRAVADADAETLSAVAWPAGE